MAEANGTATDGVPTLIKTYSEDYAGWIEDTASAIESGRFSEIDLVSLADEIRDSGKSERRELESALEVLIQQMLKSRYQPGKRTRSWELTMRVQRKHIGKFLRRSPSLRPELSELIQDAYDTARLQAADETGLDTAVFPESVSGQSQRCWMERIDSTRRHLLHLQDPSIFAAMAMNRQRP